jgi:hypothetical protein
MAESLRSITMTVVVDTNKRTWTYTRTLNSISDIVDEADEIQEDILETLS